MDLQLNARRRSVNDSVYPVFDMEAGRFKFLERSKMSFPPLIPFYNVQYKQSTQNPPNRSNSPFWATKVLLRANSLTGRHNFISIWIPTEISGIFGIMESTPWLLSPDKSAGWVNCHVLYLLKERSGFKGVFMLRETKPKCRLRPIEWRLTDRLSSRLSYFFHNQLLHLSLFLYAITC